MIGALFDTCILIDYLRGIEAARSELARYGRMTISAITWMEVMVGATPEVEQATRGFLAGFERIPVDDPVSERAVALRRTQRLRLPDAIILASAESRSLLFVTRNTKDFALDYPGIRIPYAV